MNEIKKYPVTPQDLLHEEKRAKYDMELLDEMTELVNNAYYAGFAHAIISTPEEAARITPLQISMYKLMAEENNKYLRGVSSCYMNFDRQCA